MHSFKVAKTAVTKAINEFEEKVKTFDKSEDLASSTKVRLAGAVIEALEFIDKK